MYITDLKIADIAVGNRITGLNPDAVAERASSMATEGQLVPIIIRKMADGTLKLIGGNHRVAAAKLLKWETIRAEVHDEKFESAELERIWCVKAEVVENMQRNEMDEASLVLNVGAYEEASKAEKIERDRLATEKKAVAERMAREAKEAELKAAQEREAKAKAAAAKAKNDEAKAALLAKAKVERIEAEKALEAQRKAVEKAQNVKDLRKHRLSSVADHAADERSTGTKIDGEITRELAKSTNKSERKIRQLKEKFHELATDYVQMVQGSAYGSSEQLGAALVLHKEAPERLAIFVGKFQACVKRGQKMNSLQIIDAPTIIIRQLREYQRHEVHKTKKAELDGSPTLQAKEAVSIVSGLLNDLRLAWGKMDQLKTVKPHLVEMARVERDLVAMLTRLKGATR